MRDRFGDRIHIEIETDDPSVRNGLWDYANQASDRGDDSFKLSEYLQRSAGLEQAHQIWVLVNDFLGTGGAVIGICAAVAALSVPGRRTTIRLDASLKFRRDELGKLRKLGCHITFVKDDGEETEGPEQIE